MKIKSLLLASIAGAGVLAASPALAVLTVSLQSGGVNFTCSDGQACDLAGPSSQVLVLDETVNGVNVEGTFSASSHSPDILTLSNLTISNVSGAPRVITLAASDTGYAAPVEFVSTSGSATFTNNVGGSGLLKFFADAGNAQGAGNPIATPGTLLFSNAESVTLNPESFSGTRTDPFTAHGPFSMTEAATFGLVTGGTVTGFDTSSVAGIPEPGTWAMALAGFGLMGLLGSRRRKDMRSIA